MSSFFSQASFVMDPSVYRAGTLFVPKPTDGSGDLNVTRSNDTATRVGPDGLIEKVRTNLALYSQDFSQTGTWVTSTTTRVDSQTDPNGGTTASKFTATGANSNVIQTLTVSSGIPYTWSFYAKSDSATDVNIRLDNNNGNFVQANMALTTSWQRFSITLNSNATTILCFIGGGISFTAGEVAYMAFAQLEASDIVTDYIPTTTTAVSVGPVANVPRLDYLNSSCPSLLLEPQRQNVFTFSESFDNAAWTKQDATITANSAVSPSGYQDADLYTTSTDIYDFVRQTKAFTSGTAYTLSVFVKAGTSDKISLTFQSAAFGVAGANFNLTTLAITPAGTTTGRIDNYGNGWFRCSATAQATATSNASVGFASPESGAVSTLYLWGAQLEAGAYATSYIPTLGASVTRGADACSKTGISSVIGQTEGTIFVQGEAVTIDAQANSPIYLTISDGTQSNITYIQQLSDRTIRADFFAGGVRQARIASTTNYPIGTSLKMALAYASGDFAFYINGVLIGTATGTSIPAMSQIKVGAFVLADYTGAAISQALLFKTRLPNSELAKLTSL
jgi:hypothetical protein